MLALPAHITMNFFLDYQDAPALPLPDGAQPKSQMQEMEDFLDDLLT
jgi:hypothetical protein